MQLILTKIEKKLNKAYLKQDLSRQQVNELKINLKMLLQRADVAEVNKEFEEHFKNYVSDFLKDTWYKNLYEVNNSKRKDLVIYNGKTATERTALKSICWLV